MPAKVKKPGMFSEDTLAERLATYGVPDSIHYTMGPNAVAEAQRPVDRHLETTNQRLYDQAPKDATTRSPAYFQADKTGFGRTSTLEKEARVATLSDTPAAGGKGARGEVTRRPGESVSRRCVC